MTQKPRRRWDLSPWERIQKARHAKNVKKYRTHKQRKNLVNALEKEDEPAVIVSSHLGLPGAAAEQEGEALSRAEPSTYRRTEKNAERDDESVEHEGDEESLEHEEGDEVNEEQVKEKEGKQNSHENADTAKDNDEPSKLGTEGKKNSGKARNPFQKELRRREEERKERARVEAEWKREEVEYRAKQEKSKQRRKREAKQYRSVTRRGQPRMKHRTDALLAEVQRRLGGGTNGGSASSSKNKNSS